MIWRLLTSFSLVCALASAAAVTGHVSITESGHEGSKFADPAGTVVWLEPLETVSTPVKLQAGAFRMVQKNKTFTPHVLAIPAGSTVEFPNSDPIFHNAFSNYDGQIFDIGLYPPGSTRRVTFRREGVVRVFCNIHSSMSAVIVVLGSPYFSVLEDSGAFVIDNVPSGTYRVNAFSEHATEKSLTEQSRVIEVDGGTKDIGPMTMVGSAFLTTPHLNKYGKPYPPESNSSIYPGARQ
jgi:plastocyanin